MAPNANRTQPASDIADAEPEVLDHQDMLNNNDSTKLCDYCPTTAAAAAGAETLPIDYKKSTVEERKYAKDDMDAFPIYGGRPRPPMLRKRNLSLHHAEGLMMRMIDRAENVEHAMMNMLHNAWNVCHFTHLPQWLQDNDYLHFGHRPQLESFKACFMSIFRLHTETLNIWTHAVGCLSFICISAYVLFYSYAHVPTIDKIMLSVFLGTAIICLGLSALYHTLICHSHQICVVFCKLDYCGISLLIAGSIVPCLYYIFYCHWMPKIVYITITLILCSASLIVSLFDKFSETHYRPLRAAVFASFAFSSVVPALHWYIGHSHYDIVRMAQSYQSSVLWITTMALLYLTGAVLYALRIPERFYPGKFDLYFHSHQLFHIFVFAAAVSHLFGLTTMADARLYDDQQMCPVS